LRYPAIDISGVDSELLLAVVDDYSPTAVEDRHSLLTVFFSTGVDRDRAVAAIATAFPHTRAIAREVDDEDWARRSQENLQPITVGRITIAPPWSIPEPLTPNLQPPTSDLVLIIEPSMGFGTGHHATTRLCLAALQTLDLTDAFVLDVGTGSGVLALAARQLGARGTLGIDTDGDAVRSAAENLRRNPLLNGVAFEQADLNVALVPSGGRRLASVTTANLTGALLIRSAELLVQSTVLGGHLIVSGVLDTEYAEVWAAFSPRTRLLSTTREEEWVGLLLQRTR